ncbi:hypothetical protein JOD67_001612 [Tenggerimyces flavus]|nr:hypothetical protein [Tenggerimyces flavus]
MPNPARETSRHHPPPQEAEGSTSNRNTATDPRRRQALPGTLFRGQGRRVKNRWPGRGESRAAKRSRSDASLLREAPQRGALDAPRTGHHNRPPPQPDQPARPNTAGQGNCEEEKTSTPTCEALRRRFGEYEPYQGKFAHAGEDGFASAWADATSSLYSVSGPCVLGRWAPAIVRRELPAFYASAQLSRWLPVELFATIGPNLEQVRPVPLVSRGEDPRGTRVRGRSCVMEVCGGRGKAVQGDMMSWWLVASSVPSS